MSMTHLNNKPLVNAKKHAHSTLTLVDVSDMTGKLIPLKGATVSSPVTDNHGGEWDVLRSRTGDEGKQLRLILVTSKVPHRTAEKVPEKDRVPPPDGTLTITITPMGGAPTDTTVDTDYANDPPP